MKIPVAFPSVISRLLCGSFLVSTGLLHGQSPAPSPAPSTPAVQVDRIDIVEKGLYKVEVKKEIADPKLLSGHRVVSSKAEHLKDTDTIPAVSGAQFGFRYVVTGTPKDAKVPVRIVAIYPEGGRKNPSNGKVALKDEFPQTAIIGPGTQFFFFSLKWGLVPGIWTIQVWCQDRKMAEQKFTLAP